MAEKASSLDRAVRLLAADNGQSCPSGTTLAIIDHLESCSLAFPYDADGGGTTTAASAEGKQRRGWGGARNRKDRVSHHLTQRQCENLIAAAEFLVAVKKGPNRHWTVHYEAAGVPDSEGAAFVGRLLAIAKRQVRRAGGDMAALWVRENGHHKRAHVHILLHLPDGFCLRNRTRRWIVSAGGTYRKGVSKVRVIGGQLSDAEKRTERYCENLSNVPYRQPFAVAHSLATLDVMTGGRVVMGIGSGYATQEFEAFGIPFHERGARTDEYLRLIDLLWRQDEVDFSGKFVQCQGTGLLMRPMQTPRPPIWIGAHNRRAIQRAVEMGDAWTPNCYTYPQAQPGMQMGLSRDQFIEERNWADQKREEMGKPRLECILSAGPVMDISERQMHPGRKREDIQYFTGTGTMDEILDEFSMFNECNPDGFYINFSGETIERYLQNAKMFMENVPRQLEAA